jgi:hypothetical protein
MQLTITDLKQNSSGKSWSVNKKYLVKNETAEVLKVGQTIDATIKTSEFNGKTMEWIEGFKAMAAPAASAPAATPAPANGNLFWLPFASNTVAHAVQAGYIQKPEDILGWVLAAKSAATTAAAQSDGDIPF